MLATESGLLSKLIVYVTRDCLSTTTRLIATRHGFVLVMSCDVAATAPVLYQGLVFCKLPAEKRLLEKKF